MSTQPGSVTLVGAGPGDVELLTVKAMRLIRQASVVVYDRLVGAEILDLIPADAERHDVGKRCGEPSRSQDEINALLVTLAQAGKQVIRLKGGDPYVLAAGAKRRSVYANTAFRSAWCPASRRHWAVRQAAISPSPIAAWPGQSP